jgi:uncharacterized 2Fe-2S/4Fe-4S cluster protein (DUF4445 family)
MLLSARQRRLADEILRRTEYFELTVHPAFTTQYVAALAFEPLPRPGVPVAG